MARHKRYAALTRYCFEEYKIAVLVYENLE